jgi:hypothetical protein
MKPLVTDHEHLHRIRANGSTMISSWQPSDFPYHVHGVADHLGFEHIDDLVRSMTNTPPSSRRFASRDPHGTRVSHSGFHLGHELLLLRAGIAVEELLNGPCRDIEAIR